MRLVSLLLALTTASLVGCTSPGGGGDESATEGSGTTGDTDTGTATEATETGETTGEPPELDVYGFAGGCYTVRSGERWLTADGAGTGYTFAGDQGGAARFTMKAADLGAYLLYDAGGGYLVAEDGPLLRQTSLQSDVLLVDDTYVSGAIWRPESSVVEFGSYQLRNHRNDLLLTDAGLGAEGLPVAFEAADGCVPHPELTLDASGAVMKTTHEDGDLYGVVDTHSHILSNFAFGGGGIFHGGAFHPLGVEHALPDCDFVHGEMGRKDFFGYAFDSAGAESADLTSLIPDLIAGERAEDNHATDGYPEFTGWPNGPTRSTHQTQYYRWLERAYLGGLRLVVQHATTNSVICNFTAGEGLQPTRYDCSDMTAVDRIIDETYNLERYIDAQAGGPGLGFFRIVHTPEEAREVIEGGKMAVILGIETSDLFRCKLTPNADSPTCDADYVRAQLDAYHERGIRAIFPVHKYDNAFGPGDGDRAFIELGNVLNSSHWSNFTDACPPEVSDGFDRGDVFFGGLNMPRDEYLSEPPLDLSGYVDAPLMTILPYFDQVSAPPLEGEYCQNATLTDLGETLIHELMLRGMIIEVDHLPQWSYKRAFEILEENDYPAAGTHGRNFNGQLYALGGVSKTGLGRCRGDAPGSTISGFIGRIQQIADNGGYPAEGFGFDLNGFAGARGPRFGDGACPTEQADPVTYPFLSMAGDVEFTQPVIGNRTLDFNYEGLVHIGLMPELIEDARRDAASDADLEPLFRSAEGYIRMWERAEERGAAIKGG